MMHHTSLNRYHKNLPIIKKSFLYLPTTPVEFHQELTWWNLPDVNNRPIINVAHAAYFSIPTYLIPIKTFLEPAATDDTWFLVLITCCIAVLCIAALLALFLLKCREWVFHNLYKQFRQIKKRARSVVLSRYLLAVPTSRHVRVIFMQILWNTLWLTLMIVKIFFFIIVHAVDARVAPAKRAAQTLYTGALR